MESACYQVVGSLRVLQFPPPGHRHSTVGGAEKCSSFPYVGSDPDINTNLVYGIQ